MTPQDIAAFKTQFSIVAGLLGYIAAMLTILVLLTLRRIFK